MIIDGSGSPFNSINKNIEVALNPDAKVEQENMKEDDWNDDENKLIFQLNTLSQSQHTDQVSTTTASDIDDWQNNPSYSSLHEASEQGNISMVRSILRECHFKFGLLGPPYDEK